MFAIVSKSDWVPICRKVEGVEPDPVVTWVSEAKASTFISAKGIASDYQVAPLTDDSLSKMAQALGCQADAIQFEVYPG